MAPAYRTGDPPKAEEHLQYLGSGCASISEAIRTGPSRGLRGDVLRDLHEEYRLKCSLDDQEARNRVQRVRGEQRQSQLAQRERTQAEQQQAHALKERCNAMQDTIALRRKRETGLNPKEVDALRGLEVTFNQVCLGR